MDILALNPSKKPRRAKKHAATKKAVKPMAKRRYSKKAKRRSYTKNPSNPSFARIKGKARRGYGRAKGFLAGHGIMDTFKTALPVLSGLALALLFRKKFGDAANAQAKWDWKDYLVAALGGLTGSLVSRHMFKTSPQTSNLVMLGAVTLLGYKALEEQIVPKSDTLKNWFGEDESEAEGDWSEDGVFGYLPGDVVRSESGNASVLGDDGVWRPTDDSEDLDEMGEVLQLPGSLGETLQRPGALGADPWGASPYSV